MSGKIRQCNHFFIRELTMVERQVTRGERNDLMVNETRRFPRRSHWVQIFLFLPFIFLIMGVLYNSDVCYANGGKSGKNLEKTRQTTKQGDAKARNNQTPHWSQILISLLFIL